MPDLQQPRAGADAREYCKHVRRLQLRYAYFISDSLPFPISNSVPLALPNSIPDPSTHAMPDVCANADANLAPQQSANCQSLRGTKQSANSSAH